MAKDNRKKGCPNLDCSYNKDKKFQNKEHKNANAW
jgi:hypothetical protein